MTFKSKHCKAVGILDKGIKLNLQKRLKNKLIVALPDVTDTDKLSNNDQLIKSIKTKAKGRKIVGIIGSLEKRKGILNLVKMSQQVDDKNLFYIFVGHLHKDSYTKRELRFLLETIRKKPDNCFFYLNNIIDDRLFNTLINSCDVIYLSYLNFPHSSNLLTKASHFKKPVIVSRGYYMEEIVNKYNLGLAVEPNDIDESYRAIKNLLKNNKIERKFKEYSDKNSVGILKETLQKMIKTINYKNT